MNIPATIMHTPDKISGIGRLKEIRPHPTIFWGGGQGIKKAPEKSPKPAAI